MVIHVQVLCAIAAACVVATAGCNTFDAPPDGPEEPDSFQPGRMTGGGGFLGTGGRPFAGGGGSGTGGEYADAVYCDIVYSLSRDQDQDAGSDWTDDIDDIDDSDAGAGVDASLCRYVPDLPLTDSSGEWQLLVGGNVVSGSSQSCSSSGNGFYVDLDAIVLCPTDCEAALEAMLVELCFRHAHFFE